MSYIYAWGPRWKNYKGLQRQLDRKGDTCELLVRGKKMNSCLIQFQDGERHIVSRNALRKVVSL